MGGYHDTTSDLVDLYDLDRVPKTHQVDLMRAQKTINRARRLNAYERCAKFKLAPQVHTLWGQHDLLTSAACTFYAPSPELTASQNLKLLGISSHPISFEPSALFWCTSEFDAGRSA